MKKEVKTLAMLTTISVTILLLWILNWANRSYPLPPIKTIKQQAAVNFNNHTLEVLSLGKKRMISALLWIVTMIESDHDHYKKKDYGSWIFLRLKSITLLDPLFQEAYLYGGQYLSVIKDDDLGAKYIYDRGMQKLPDDFYITLYAGFHYYLELNDFKTAASLFKKIKDHPNMSRAMPNIDSFIARLYEKGGDLKTSLMLLDQIIQNPKTNPKTKERLESRSEEIRDQLQKNK
jgi:hypothetical protein